MVCKIKFGAKILPVYSPLNIKVKEVPLLAILTRNISSDFSP